MSLCSLWQASLNGKILKLPKLFEHAEHWSSQTIWNTLRRLQNYKQCFFLLFCFVLSECTPNLWDLLPHHTTPKLSIPPLCILCCQTLNNKIVLGARVPCSHWKALLLPVMWGLFPYSGVMCCDASLNPRAARGLTFPAGPTTAPAFCVGRNATVDSVRKARWPSAQPALHDHFYIVIY